MRKKGQTMPEDMGMTIIFLVIVVVMVLIGLLLSIKLKIPYIKDGELTDAQLISYSIDFVSIANRPYMITDVLTSVRSVDRNVLEKSLEIAIAGSLENAQATELPDTLESFMKSYSVRNYYISVKRDNNEIMNADSMQFKCGEKLEGWCVSRRLTGESCDVGRIEIEDADVCKPLQVCCKHDANAYLNAGGDKDVITCENAKGVCSAGRKLTTWVNLIPIRTGPFCDAGQVYLGKSSECDGKNSGETRACCAPLTAESSTETGISSKAVVPLLYKNLYGALEVTTKQ